MSAQLNPASNNVGRPLFLLVIPEARCIPRERVRHAYSVPTETFRQLFLTPSEFAAERTRPNAEKHIFEHWQQAVCRNLHTRQFDCVRMPVTPSLTHHPEVESRHFWVARISYRERERGVEYWSNRRNRNAGGHLYDVFPLHFGSHSAASYQGCGRAGVIGSPPWPAKSAGDQAGDQSVYTSGGVA